MEIEKKFLLNEIPNLSLYNFKTIKQAYVSTSPVIRLRQLDDLYFLTVKSHGHLAREEFELTISKEEFENLSTKIEGSIISKTRYYIPISDNFTAELDIYYDDLEGLSTVEVEFDSIQSANNFIPPKWFGKDITMFKEYKNNHLALYGLPQNS